MSKLVMVVAAVLLGVLAVGPVNASHNGTLEERRAAREAQRALDRAIEEGTACGCSASLKYGKPSLQFSGGALVFIPRVDVTIRTTGLPSAPGWSADVAYDGDVSFDSDDVSAPGPQSFNGTKTIAAGSCGKGTYRFTGQDLARVPLAGITPSLLGDDERLDGTIRLQSALSNCGTVEEERQMSFSLREFGNLVVRGWRSVR